MIPTEQYTQIIEVLPILCVDVVIMNSNGEYLLVKRANEPLEGHWWVIGGRVYKGETMEQAAIRKVKEEVGLDVRSLRLIGYYEEVFRENPFGLTSGLHTVSVVFATMVDGYQPVKLDSQSTDWKYSPELPDDFCIRSFDDHSMGGV
jgi:colanic acid biosynthesis protein WcaH